MSPRTDSPPGLDHVAGSEDLVTVVVPARNEERHLGPCLDSILAQDHGRLEVLVVDGDSDDATPSIVRRYVERDARVRLLHNPEQRIPQALNLALREAEGRWLVRVDAHSTIPSDYVTRAVENLRTGRWGGVGGRKDAVGNTPAGRAIAAAHGSRFGIGDSTYHYGTERQTVDHVPFGAYPVDLARELGGWDERLSVNEDYEFDFRVRSYGRELLFDPDMRIEWRSRQTIPELFDQYRRYGRGKATTIALQPGTARPRHLAAPLLIASWVLAVVLAVRRPRLGGLVATPYPVALALASAVNAPRLPARSRGWLPLAYAAMHVAWGLGFWEGALRSLRDGTPER